MGTTTPTQNPAAGGTSIISARDLQPGMVFMHHGQAMQVATIEDTSAPAWMRAGCDPGHFTVTCADGYQLTIPRINTVQVVADSIKLGHLHTKRDKGAEGFHSRYFLSIHTASKFQARLNDLAHRSSRMEWFSVAFDNPSTLMRVLCRRFKKDGLYRVTWLEGAK
jgi:hypothetical protein